MECGFNVPSGPSSGRAERLSLTLFAQNRASPLYDSAKQKCSGRSIREIQASFTFLSHHRPFIRSMVPRSSYCPMPIFPWREWIWQYNNIYHCVLCVRLSAPGGFLPCLLDLNIQLCLSPSYTYESQQRSQCIHQKPPRVCLHHKLFTHLVKSCILCFYYIAVGLNW